MIERQITDVVKSKDGTTHVEIEGGLYPVSTVIDWILNKEFRFYTLVDEYKSYVLLKRSSLGNLFLVTSPDGIERNNLSSLSR